MAEDDEEDKLILGHEGTGDDCIGKVFNFGRKFMIGGGLFGVAEGCFLTPIPGSTTPMVVRSLRLAAQRSLLLGTAGGVYACAICNAARVRDKDDFVNASIGGALAGGVFGFRYKKVSVGLGLGLAFSVVLGLVKFRLDLYLPPVMNIKPLPTMGPVSLLKETDASCSEELDK